jgi:hypothetical protein
VTEGGQAPVIGSVTVFNTTYNSMTAGVKLVGVSPNNPPSPKRTLFGLTHRERQAF